MEIETEIIVRKPEDILFNDPLELELYCSYRISVISHQCEFTSGGLERISLEELNDFASGKSDFLSLEDSNGSVFLKWVNGRSHISFNVTRPFSECSFTILGKGVVEKIISQYKTFIKE